jgi:hypothetical protein
MLSVSSLRIAHRREHVITSASEPLGGVTAEPRAGSGDEHAFRHIGRSCDHPNRTDEIKKEARIIVGAAAGVNYTPAVTTLMRNSSFIIHPEEILADNFATLMEWRSDGVLQPANPGGFPTY